MRPLARLGFLVLAFALSSRAGLSEAASTAQNGAVAGIWSHDNLVAWCVVPFDAKKRGPEERARMLSRLGFPSFAYDWRDQDVPTFDAEIEALQRHGIKLLAWWFPFEPTDPLAKATLETFRRHGVHPQLWVMQSMSWWHEKVHPLPQTPAEQEARVRQEADRIAGLARLAGPYGCRVELYNHNGWYGVMENELAILARLRELGIGEVGLVYNFSHCRDADHDDPADFRRLWPRIKDHVVAVNVVGIGPRGEEVYPSQGDSELGMMRVIQESGWRGPVGLIAEQGGDAEVTLRQGLRGLDWLAAELRRPGSGGPKPVF